MEIFERRDDVLLIYIYIYMYIYMYIYIYIYINFKLDQCSAHNILLIHIFNIQN